MTKHPAPASAANALLGDIRALIEDARAHVARAANSALTLTYWRVGRRIGAESLAASARPMAPRLS